MTSRHPAARWPRLCRWVRPERRCAIDRAELVLAARMWRSARAALRADSRIGIVRRRYYADDAWAVSADPHAAPPHRLGDQHFRAWTPTYAELGKAP